MVLVDENSTFYFNPGDCSLIPVKEYIQLSLFQCFYGKPITKHSIVNTLWLHQFSHSASIIRENKMPTIPPNPLSFQDRGIFLYNGSYQVKWTPHQREFSLNNPSQPTHRHSCGFYQPIRTHVKRARVGFHKPYFMSISANCFLSRYSNLLRYFINTLTRYCAIA